MENIVIKVVELSQLTKTHAGLTEQFFKEVLEAVPLMGKIHPRYFILNTNLTLQNPANMAVVNYFNTFVTIAATKAHLIQITKN